MKSIKFMNGLIEMAANLFLLIRIISKPKRNNNMPRYLLWALSICFCLALAAPLSASTIMSDVQFSNISVTLSSLDHVTTGTAVSGSARTNPDENVNLTTGPYTGGVWLKNMTGTSQYITSTGQGSLASTVMGIGPNPGPNPTGTLYERADGELHYWFTSPGTYTFSITGDWTARVQVSDQDKGFPVSFVSFHSWIVCSVNPEGQDLLLIPVGINADDKNVPPIANYDSGLLTGHFDLTGTITSNVLSLALGADQTVRTVQAATPSPAPLPPAFLLFGSGLLGLVGWIRFR